MPDAVKSLEIQISTPAELEGAKSVEASLERQIGKAKVLKQDYSQLDAQLKQVRSSIAEYNATQQQSGQVVDEVEKKTGFLNLRKQELKKVVNSLARDFPEAGRAARFFINPLVSGITTVIGLFALAKRSLASWNEELDKMEARNKERDFLPGIDAAKKALREGAQNARDFAIEMNKIGKGPPTVEETLKKIVDEIEEIQAAISKQIDSQLGLRLSEINLAEKQKRITPAQADVLRFQAESAAAQRQEENRRLAEQEQFLSRQQALDLAKQKQPGLEKAAAQAADAASKTDAHIKKVEADAEAQRPKLAELDVGKLAEAVDKAREVVERASKTPFVPDEVRAAAANKLSDAELALRDFNARKALVDKAETEGPGLRDKLNQQARERDAAQKAARENKGFIESESRDLPEDAARVRRQRGERSVIQRNEQQKRVNDLAGDLAERSADLNDDLAKAQAKQVSNLRAAKTTTASVVDATAQVRAELDLINAAIANLSKRPNSNVR